MATKDLIGNETFTDTTLTDYTVTNTDSVGNNTLTLGDGTDQITLGSGGSNTVSVGSGNDTITAGGASNTITTGNGNSQITTAGGNNTVTVGMGANTIALGNAASGTPDTVQTGAGGNTLSVSAAAITGDTLMGAMVSGDGSTNRIVLTTTGTMSPVNVNGFQSYQLANGGANSLTLVDANFARLPGQIAIIGGDSGNTIDASSLSAADAVRVFAGAGADAFTGGAGNDTFVFAPGDTSGDTADGGAGNNTLELAIGGAGTLNGLGTNFVNIGTVLLDATATWSIGISDVTKFTGTIVGFDPSDTFDLTAVAFDAAGSATLLAGNVLQITENSSTFTINLDPSQNFTGDTFHLATNSASGTLVSEQVCLCRGTRILTDQGEIPVEALTIGDRVKTLSGDFKPIRWIGFGRDLVTRKNPLARPIIVSKGALADNVPRRDLYLTHGHSLYLDGVLIPVENLLNHRSIRWDDEARVVEYYHIELDDHDVVFAEGAPAETYYAADNRALFQNTRPGSTPGAARTPFAPVLHDGEIVGRVWTRLDERAGERAAVGTTVDPDLHLVAAGERLDPAMIADGLYSFVFDAVPTDPIFLSSRSAVPSSLGYSRHEHRRLGVAIRQIVLSRPGVMSVFDHDAPLFGEGGCHAPESGFCWTDGELPLPAALFSHLTGPFRLFVQTARLGMRYPLALPAARAA